MSLRAITAITALLIGAALFWAIAANPDDESSSERVITAQEKQAVRIERRLDTKPNDKRLLLATMYAWVGAGSAWFETTGNIGKPVPSTVREDYEAGLRAWNDYLGETGGEASIDDAEYAGSAFFSLVEIGSTDPSKATANAAGAARALRIACRHERTLFNLSNLASYQYFNGEYAAGDRAAREAAAEVRGAAAITPREVIEELNGYRERGEKFVGRVERGFKTLEETGEEELENPIKGYGSTAGINGYEPESGPT